MSTAAQEKTYTWAELDAAVKKAVAAIEAQHKEVYGDMLPREAQTEQEWEDNRPIRHLKPGAVTLATHLAEIFKAKNESKHASFTDQQFFDFLAPRMKIEKLEKLDRMAVHEMQIAITQLVKALDESLDLYRRFIDTSRTQAPALPNHPR